MKRRRLAEVIIATGEMAPIVPPMRRSCISMIQVVLLLLLLLSSTSSFPHTTTIRRRAASSFAFRPQVPTTAVGGSGGRPGAAERGQQHRREGRGRAGLVADAVRSDGVDARTLTADIVGSGGTGDDAVAARPRAAPAAANAVAILAAVAIASSVSFSSPAPALAYDDADYAGEAVTVAVTRLDEAGGDVDRSLAALEGVAEIVTEGKGVGGSLSYGGVQLERGLVADEDTTIYNPGLTLLTESEKSRLVDAVIRNRKVGTSKGAWSEDNQLGYEFLKERLDPFHTVELRGYLGILPFYGAALYLAALAVQQNFRSLFPVAYIACALAVFAPILVLIAAGP